MCLLNLSVLLVRLYNMIEGKMQLDTLYIVAIVTCLFNVGYSFISLGAVKSEGLFQPYLYFFNINLLERNI